MLKTVAPARESIDMSAIDAELRPHSTEKLTFYFFEYYQGASTLIARAAVCVKLLKERGHQEILKNIPYADTFLRIAEGHILPELHWRFLQSRNRRRVEGLLLTEQRRLAADPTVPVVESSPEGGFTTRLVDLVSASADEARLAIGPDGIRSPEQQIAHLHTQKSRPRLVRPSVDEGVCEPLDRRITIRLTASELKTIRRRALDLGKTEREVIRHFLLRSGAFQEP